jgi:hypothetical protein
MADLRMSDLIVPQRKYRDISVFNIYTLKYIHADAPIKSDILKSDISHYLLLLKKLFIKAAHSSSKTPVTNSVLG